MKKLQNKVALITGGSSGIGFATAKLMLNEGAKVIIVGRNQPKLDEAIKQLDDNVSGICADASTINGIEAIIGKVKNEYGKIDVLFANAGMSECPPILETDEHFFNKIIGVNVKSVFFLFIKAFPLLSINASVIFTSSVHTVRAARVTHCTQQRKLQ